MAWLGAVFDRVPANFKGDPRGTMYLFFIRQFNDIDHITPIVWKMHSDGKPVAVYCLDPAYDLGNDYRLSFLRSCGVKVRYVYDERVPRLNFRHDIMRLISRLCYAASNRLKATSSGRGTPLTDIVQRRLYKSGKKIFRRGKNADYNHAWAVALLTQTAARALCFDHVSPGRHVVAVLLKAAQSLAIPTFALPHGVFIYTNQEVRSAADQVSRFDKFNRYDFIVTQNTLRKEVLVRAGVNPAKIHVLGSARYSDEWMSQNKSILPRKMDPNLSTTTRLKAVFMTTRFSYQIDVARMLKTFDLLTAIDHLHLVVKPHTRSGREAEVYDRLAVRNVSDLSSVELCEWADLVFVIGSSILIEPLKLNKPVLYLKYLHANTTQYEEMGACWTLHDEQELLQAVRRLQANHQDVPYSAANVEAFLDEIVSGGGGSQDVLKVYTQFIVAQSA